MQTLIDMLVLVCSVRWWHSYWLMGGVIPTARLMIRVVVKQLGSWLGWDRFIHTAHYTLHTTPSMHTLHWTLHAHIILYIAHWRHTPYCTLQTVFTLQTSYCILDSEHFIQKLHTSYTLHTTHYTLYTFNVKLLSAQNTQYSLQYNAHTAL